MDVSERRKTGSKRLEVAMTVYAKMVPAKAQIPRQPLYVFPSSTVKLSLRRSKLEGKSTA